MCYDNSMVIVKCIKCREEKSESDFRFWRGKRNKWCTECRERNNTWYAQDKDGRRTKAKLYYQRTKHNVARYRSDLRLDRKYNLTRQEWDDMFAEQKGFCGICGEYMKSPVVDHNHQTGEVRGLLHQRCNLRLEAIEDEEFKIKAQAYLDSMK